MGSLGLPWGSYLALKYLRLEFQEKGKRERGEGGVEGEGREEWKGRRGRSKRRGKGGE